MTKFYITTPIYYVNDRPHIGHAYTTIVADTIARYAKQKKLDVSFASGTDENSQKTVDAAAKAGEDPTAYVVRLAEAWKSTWEKLGIGITDFIQTTEPRHKKTVHEIWKRIGATGDIYKGKYEGLYCTGHEAFLKESDLVDGLCPDHKTKPERLAEENYFFKLSKYEKPLLEFYGEHPDFVMPQNRFQEVKSFVTQGLEDISISRETKKWGIPVPSDPNQVVYVWFDALINYITVAGIEGWEKHPADVHTIGKDILRFHAVIWPAMLLSAGLPLPKQVAANGFFTIAGVKISKSLGNAVDPLDIANRYGRDALRYFLLREIPYGEDGDFSEEKFLERYNADLANGLGNLVARVAALGERCGEMEINGFAGRETMPPPASYERTFLAYRFSDVLTQIWQEFAAIDKNVNDQKLWEQDGKILAHGVAACALGILYQVRLLEPFMPDTVEKIRKCFALDGKMLRVTKGESLFPRK